MSVENPYAGFWRRVLAYLIDFVIMLVVLTIAGAAFAGLGAKGRPGLLGLMYLILPPLYFVILESSAMQGTLGKKVVGLKVTNLLGEKISGGRALGRYLLKIVSGFTLGVGFAMAGGAAPI